MKSVSFGLSFASLHEILHVWPVLDPNLANQAPACITEYLHLVCFAGGDGKATLCANNSDFLLRNPDFDLKTGDFII